ncbi:uncharacterized protein LOC119079230 [Bradysia coprophila]|uniref:uncharacterized protein LOC119079230 n=1 Tax=Bradysia coprophila TaxID=38358 RepID=UPI00187DB69B|nr:uncharacterized protein LOC119079230 [Bradysia coprophila]
MDLAYFQSPNGKIYAKSPGGSVYECEYVSSEDSHSQYEKEDPVSQSSELDKLLQNPLITVTKQPPQSNGDYDRPQIPEKLSQTQSARNSHAKRKNLTALDHSSTARRSLEYTMTVDEEPLMKQKRKNEKERMCHVAPSDVLNQYEEELLRMIFEAPPIWNFKIPIKDRHPEAKSKKWIEIKNDFVAYLQGIESPVDMSKIKVELLKNTWNHIRESYVRYTNARG